MGMARVAGARTRMRAPVIEEDVVEEDFVKEDVDKEVVEEVVVGGGPP